MPLQIEAAKASVAKLKLIKIILDKVFAVSDEEETDGKEASEKVKENIESESDTQNDE